ncbi:Uncharacterized protein dnm_040870 [Desulfonema magnum]|uniref:Uncharacterized protein n=1 Tax=Desulfonema magnum TaxID=45655 RepID=A0A975GNR6_9BACT|nr:Uncharacterized protein dnm_040870 [Desulfonema magnum]
MVRIISVSYKINAKYVPFCTAFKNHFFCIGYFQKILSDRIVSTWT